MKIGRFPILALLLCPVLAWAAPAENLTPAEARKLTREAYIYGYPLIENYRTMFFFALDKGSAEYKGPFNTIVHLSRASAGDGVASPNNDTLTSFAWLDLRNEPVVITVPPGEKGRYYSVTLVDLYTFNFATIGTRVDKNLKGGNYLITGPTWKKPTPGGITMTYPCETQFALAIFRNQLLGDGDGAALSTIQQAFRVRTLGAFLRKPIPNTVKPTQFPGYVRSRADGVEFISYLNFILQYCAPHPSETALMARLARIGVGPGKPFDERQIPPDILEAMKKGVEDALAEVALALPKVRSLYQLYGSRAVMKGNFFNRFLGAKLGLYAGDWEETLFIPVGVDAEGRPLDGANGNRYTLRFPPGQLPPVNAFWSLTLYDGQSRSFSRNLYNRYAINSSIKPDLVPDADGGYTIYLQKDSPGPGPDANWLPAPNGPFYLTMRLYWPKPTALEGKWMMPVPKRQVMPVAAEKEEIFNPPFVKEVVPTPTPGFLPLTNRTVAPFVEDKKATPAPSPTATPRTYAPFVKEPGAPTPEPDEPMNIPVARAEAVPARPSATPTPAATPYQYAPRFVEDEKAATPPAATPAPRVSPTPSPVQTSGRYAPPFVTE